MSTGAIRIYNWPPSLPHGHGHGHGHSNNTALASGNAVSNAVSSMGKNTPALSIIGSAHYTHTYIHTVMAIN